MTSQNNTTLPMKISDDLCTIVNKLTAVSDFFKLLENENQPYCCKTPIGLYLIMSGIIDELEEIIRSGK